MSAVPDPPDPNPGPVAERMLRKRAAASFHPDDPPAREWLALAVQHVHPTVASLAADAQLGTVPVAQVVAAVEDLERCAARAAAVRSWMATHTRDDLAAVMDGDDAAEDLERTTPRRELRAAALELSDESQAFLREVDIWSDEPRVVDLRDLERGPRARNARRSRRR